ncbi:helix-turn-helix transcriptional regulator [Spirosoma sp. SC4-14]|uniref:helix-turn-helix domain-containing protein n=1 Tax=Spirosoma sp. SC4-14 TaxID=3128900 RepID=UPI0030CD6D15
MDTLIHTIRTIRHRLHYSQEAMAYELGISQTAYSYLEKNEDILTIGRLVKIATIFNLPIVELIKPSSEIHKMYALPNPVQSDFSIIPITIGGRIRFLREKQGLRQQELAYRMGISQKTYSMIESADDSSQKIGRLKQVATSLSFSDWTVFLLPELYNLLLPENESGALTHKTIVFRQ